MPGEDAPRRKAFPDSSVLYPISILDLLMSLAESLVHQLVLSEDLLAELARTWDEGRAAGKRVPTVGAADAALRGIREAFPDAFVARPDYEASIAEMPGTDENDKPHSAAAVIGRATHIVTNDRAGGFPSEALAELGVVVQSADAYLAELARAYPADVAAVVRHMAAKRARKIEGLTTATLAERWRAAGLTAFHAALVDALNA